MIEFFRALTHPDLAFLRYAFVTSILASVAFGIVGSYVVARRVSYIAGAISHSILGGIGAGLFIKTVVGIGWFHPMYGAITAAIVSAVLIGLISLKAQQRVDTVTVMIWACGMAIGEIFIKKTPGYIEPMNYLFGNILLLSEFDMWIVIGLDILVVFLAVMYYRKFLAICFDEEFSRVRGLQVEFYYLLLLCLTALTVVLLVPIVGIVLVIALLTIPAAVAGNFSKRLWQMMIIAVLFCMLFTILGLAVSYAYNMSSGSTIIVIAGSFYLLQLGVTYVIGLVRG